MTIKQILIDAAHEEAMKMDAERDSIIKNGVVGLVAEQKDFTGTTTTENVSAAASKMIGFYLDWVNNFISLDVMAEHYGITKHQASAIVQAGRILHESKCAEVSRAGND